MTATFPIAFVITPDVTFILFEAFMPRQGRYTDGRSFPDEEPSYQGYSIGKWRDTDGDGRYDTLEVETRNFKGPRTYENSGLPLHPDNASVILERISLDKSNPDILHNEITAIDHALTRPWTVIKTYRRDRKELWQPAVKKWLQLSARLLMKCRLWPGCRRQQLRCHLSRQLRSHWSWWSCRQHRYPTCWTWCR